MTNETADPPHHVPDADDDWDWVEEDSRGWVPPTVDTSKPSVARIYDFLIGGKDNFAVDREAAQKLLALIPGVAVAARANRTFLIRAVQDMASSGIDQFLDLGTGIPTSPNVHETARALRPDTSVVYVDNDPTVLAYSRALLSEDERLLTVPHDIRDPRAVLDDPAVRSVLDFDRPIGVLMVAVLHFVDLNAAPAIVGRYLQDLPAGSRVALTAACRDGVDPAVVSATENLYANSSASIVHRTKAQIEELFEGLELLPPGVHDIYNDHGRVMGATAVKR